MTRLLVLFHLTVLASCYQPNSDIGFPAGLVPDCPGVVKNASISSGSLPFLQVAVQRVTPIGVYRKKLPVASAHKSISSDRNIDLRNRKTVFYAVGFWDSSIFPHSQALGNAYSRRGYNVFISETLPFLTYVYPKSVRLARVIGRKYGEFLVKLTERGLRPENLELVGMSLGAHIVSHAAKYYFEVTGKKPSRLTGLDPAGPCYRSLPTNEKLWHTDALRVDVLHTNIDGFGIAEPLGHIDFYANGGEYQPGDIPALPCLVLCSHIRALIYWWQAVEHPNKFIGVKCDSVQDARLAKCYNGTEFNYLGLGVDFNKRGIFYLPTHNEFPYYRGKDGLKPENEIYTSVSRAINADDYFVT